MKVNFNQLKLSNNVQFEGYKPVKSDYGKKEFEFNYAFDDGKFDCYLELFSVEKDKDGNYFTTGILENYNALLDNSDNTTEIKLENGKPAKINLARDYGLSSDDAFAYHYKLYPKNNHNASPRYVLDAGMMINEAQTTGNAQDIYNIITDRNSGLVKGGAMKLIIPDINNVSWVYDDNNKIVPNKNIEQARKTNKNFANKIGGSLAGIEKDLDDGKLDSFSRIITTPLFTDDSLSAHAYWNKNCFQMAHSLGNINNYTSVQKKMFAKGMNMVSDGAYVNEGLEGIHFKHVLRWGDKSPYFNWFNISNLDQAPLGMGVFGKDTEHVTHRLVNSPYKFEQLDNGKIKISSQKYDSKAPTYIQVYDDRLVNADKLSDKELIKAYDRLCEEQLEINNHNDTVVPYSFRINPETYKKNVELLNEHNQKAKTDNEPVIDLKSALGTRMVSHFEYFGLDGKHEGGFETWDANVDIARLAFVTSHAETQNLKNIPDPEKREAQKRLIEHKHFEVQDYAVSAGKYWTQKTNRILNLNAAQHLKNLSEKNVDEIFNKITEQADGKVFPKDLDVTKTIVKNVLNNRYELKGAQSKESYDNIILRGLMDTPLDSIEIGDDIAAVFASPFISKRAGTEAQLGLSRFDMYQQKNPHLLPEYEYAYKQADKMYLTEMSNFAKDILKTVEDKLPKENKLHDEKGNATAYAKYILPHLTSEIARFAIIKSVSPKAEFKSDNETGELSYNYKELKNTSLLSMGIIADSPEDEAVSLISKVKSGIKNISNSDKEKLADALYKSIKGTNVESFKLAEMIVNRSGAGLDWRIDATKDIGDIESVRRQKTDFTNTWNSVIKFWSKFTDGVKEYHPAAYIAAEVTDEGEIYGKGSGYKSGARYSNVNEAVKKLINEAGFTTTANYTHFSSDITKIFGKLFDYDGASSPDKGYMHGTTILEQLIGGGNFLNFAPLEAILYSYTFAGNHDKCRALDGFATDMDMVYTDLSEQSNFEYRNRAYKLLKGIGYGTEPDPNAVNNYDFRRVSNLAVAKAESISSGMGKATNEIGMDAGRSHYIYEQMIEALKNITNGRHKGKLIEADGFGSKDYNFAIDTVLDEMDFIAPDSRARLTKDERKKLKDKTLENIIDPAMSRLLGQTKFLTALVGNPTLFAGDEYGSTGYETTSKNIYLQNRNIIRDDWADPKSPEYKEFVKRHKDYMDYQFNLRARKELHPLNDGAPIALKEQKAYLNNGRETTVSALLRHSTDGAMTISVFNTEGLVHKFDEYYRPAEIKLNSIDLTEGRDGKAGLAGGLKPGTKFVNANDKNDIYYVNGNNQLTRPEGADRKPIGPITINDSTLVLYHEPTFTGRRSMYNAQYHFTSNPYQQKQQSVTGSKLAVVK